MGTAQTKHSNDIYLIVDIKSKVSSYPDFAHFVAAATATWVQCLKKILFDLHLGMISWSVGFWQAYKPRVCIHNTSFSS
jgi:hypothetical protein